MQLICSPADYVFLGDEFFAGVICSESVKCPAQQASRHCYTIDKQTQYYTPLVFYVSECIGLDGFCCFLFSLFLLPKRN